MEIFMNSLTKKYGKITALNNINLNIKGQGCVGLLGPNGAGKTTMLKLITNIIKPTHGGVQINGINVSENPEKGLNFVGSLIEQPEFYTYLTGNEILDFTRKIKGIGKEDFKNKIGDIINTTQISTFIDRKTGSYSRGMKQRLALAVAMIGDPEIIILDEPTFGLDPKGMKDIRTLISNLAKTKLILLSTHLIYEAREICDRTIIINNGIIEHDSNMADNKFLLKITLDSPERSIVSGKIKNYAINGNEIIVEKYNDYENYEIIEDLINQGIKVKYVEQFDNLEDVYISITKKNKVNI